MGEQYTSLLSCPRKNCRVVCAGETNVLKANDVQSWLPTQQATDDVVVEILVSGQP